MKKKEFLHLGCGLRPIQSDDVYHVTNLDILELPGVDIVAPAFPLTFPEGAFHLVYASHLLEHYSKKLVPEVLKEWTRILKQDGKLRVSVPNFAVFAELYVKYKRLDLMGPVLGAQHSFYDYHFSIFDERTLASLMESAGLVAVHPWLPERVFHTDTWDFSQAETMGLQISLNLEGRKK